MTFGKRANLLLRSLIFFIINASDDFLFANMLHKRISKKTRWHNTTLLGRAVISGNLARVKFLLKRGVRVNRVNNLGQSFLHLNAIEGNACITQCLVKSGCSVNSRNAIGDTPLHLAVTYGNKHVASYLIVRGAKVNFKNTKGNTPFHNAIRSGGKADIIKLLICSGANVHELNANGYNTVYLAAKSQNKKALKLLINKGVNVNCPESKVSALHEVASYGNEQMMKMLLEAGADVNHRDSNDCIPVQCAVYAGNFEVVKMLMDAGSLIDNQNKIGATVLHNAVMCKHPGMVEYLLSLKPNIQLKTTDGDTALHWAAMLNVNGSHTNTIKSLVTNKAHMNDRNANGQTPFHFVVQNGDEELVAFALEHGAEVNMKDFDGSTALHYAVYNDNPQVLSLLLDRGIDVKHRCFRGVTALHHAAKEFRSDYVDLLLNSGANVDAKDVCLRTPLLYAIVEPSKPELAEKRSKTIKTLLERGTDLSTPVQQDRLMIEIAMERKDEYIISMLIKYIALAESRLSDLDQDNYTALSPIDKDLDYYEDCVDELKLMKRELIYGRVSVYDLLIRTPNEVTAYARNEDLVQAFHSNCWTIKFPVYWDMVEARFKEAIDRNELLTKATFVLWNIMEFAYPEHVMYERVLGYLSPSDLLRITDDSDEILC